MDICIWIHGYMDIWAQGYLNIWIWIYGYMDIWMWMYGYVDIWIYGRMGIQIWTYGYRSFSTHCNERWRGCASSQASTECADVIIFKSI